MAKNENKKQQEAIKEYLLNYGKRQKAGDLFRRFIERVEFGAVKNDGTDGLLKIIDEQVIDDKQKKFIKTLKVGKILYRARIVDPEQLIESNGFHFDNGVMYGFDEAGSREAPIGLSAEGRNNNKGVSYLYVADNPETACAEVKSRVRQMISVAKFKVAKTLKIIDFSRDITIVSDGEEVSLGALFTDIMFLYTRPVNDLKEYKATQFLTDYLRKTGIDGICYRSYFDAKGINYTIFNSDHRYIEFVESNMYLHQSERKTYLDFNQQKVINSNSAGGADYDYDSAAKMLFNIKINIKKE